MEKTTILIADDHTLIRETWSLILNADPRFRVIAEAGTGESAIQKTRALRPDVVIMDINLPGLNGIEATEMIHKHSPATKVLGVSLHTQPTYARKMMQIGAMGYVTKTSSRDEMLLAIAEIRDGRKYMCDEIKNILSEQMIQGDKKQNGLNALSLREVEVISFVRKGFSSKEIADALSISVKTVEVHRYNILRKLNLRNAASLVNFINSNYLEFEAHRPN
jgi:two-component system invasion response regulator UvrY